MAVRKSGLGKGLDSLISDKVSVKQTTTSVKKDEKKVETLVKISKVEPNRDQPRKKFDEDALLELSESIKQFGVLQPLLVQKRDDYYEIIAGERRWRAAKLAGLKEVPVIVKDLTEKEIMEIALIENIQREDLNPIEEALAYKRLLEEFHVKHDVLAERVSKSRSTITNSMRLLKLCDKVQQMIIDGQLTMGHVRPLIMVEDSEKQFVLAQKIFDEKLSVRETEKLVKKAMTEKPVTEEKEKTEDYSVFYENLQEQLKQILGTKVTIKSKNNKKGKIEIEYYSNDELEQLMEMISSIKR